MPSHEEGHPLVALEFLAAGKPLICTDNPSFDGMYDHGAGPWIDGISIHPYDWAGTIHWRAVTDTRNVMVANGDAAKGIWITEYGWNSGDEQEKATKLTQVLTELKKPEYSYVVQANYRVLPVGMRSGGPRCFPAAG